MSFWVYKCNAHPQARNAHLPTGDWDYVFKQKKDKEVRWGSSASIPRLVGDLQPGDLVIACQTDRKELVGVAEVVRIEQDDEHTRIVLRGIEELRVQLPLLKRLDPGAFPFCAHASTQFRAFCDDRPLLRPLLQ